MDNKTDYRKYAKELRKTLDIAHKSKILTDKIRKNELYTNAKKVMLFYPMEFEIDLRDLLKDDKTFYLPKVSGKGLLACPYSEKLTKSAMGIREPDTLPINPCELDLIIVPALMTDKKGYRLGYGGGYYDRFITSTDAKTICAIPEELTVDELPYAEHDIKIDCIITA